MRQSLVQTVARASPIIHADAIPMIRGASTAIGVLAVGLTACSGHEMSFFVTSVRTGDGGNLGGVAGADDHCVKLATAAGSRKHEWRAYLSAAQVGGRPTVQVVVDQRYELVACSQVAKRPFAQKVRHVRSPHSGPSGRLNPAPSARWRQGWRRDGSVSIHRELELLVRAGLPDAIEHCTTDHRLAALYPAMVWSPAGQ
jgi:hypothetical protein